MARALVTNVGSRVEVIGGVPKIQVEIVYGGADVPGTYQNKGVMVDITGVQDAAGLATAIAAAVRAHATTQGYTVGASLVFQPSYAAT